MIANLAEDMVGVYTTPRRRTDEVTIAHAIQEQNARVERANKQSRIPELRAFSDEFSELFVRDFGMYTQEGNREVTKLLRYIEDMMRRRVWTGLIRSTINLGLKNIAKQGHSEVYDSWVLNEMEGLLDQMVEDLVNGPDDTLQELYEDPVNIDVPEGVELAPFRQSAEDGELYQLPVP